MSLSVYVHDHEILQVHNPFQVAWIGQKERTTWEPASVLPQALIDEFEGGVVNEQRTVTDSKYGVVNHTIVVTTVDAAHAPPSKKTKTTIPSNPG